MKKVIVLWSHPRSRSTALERAFIERDDCYVIHEPLSMSKYRGIPEDIIIDDLLNLPYSIDNGILANITHKCESPEYIVIKDFPYHSTKGVHQLFNTNYLHAFSVRIPLDTILSWQIIHPSFDESELGYVELLEAMQLAKVRGIYNIPLLHANDIVQDPENALKRLCLYLGITYKNKMCNWTERNEIDSWREWDKYHTTATTSKGFINTETKKVALTVRNRMFLEKVTSVYNEILEQ